VADETAQRSNRLDFAHRQLRDALRQCDELMARTERMLRESDQDNQPRKG
jgi:hypothetical protein